MSKEQTTAQEALRRQQGSRGRGLILIVAALLLLSTLTIGARAWLRAPLETVSITVHATGFAPSEMTRAAGSFNLAVANQSGAGELSLRLTRDSGELVREFSVPQGAQQGSAELELSAGGYTLTEANHPAWLFHITAQ
jgi:hypothetical protein